MDVRTKQNQNIYFDIKKLMQFLFIRKMMSLFIYIYFVPFNNLYQRFYQSTNIYEMHSLIWLWDRTATFNYLFLQQSKNLSFTFLYILGKNQKNKKSQRISGKHGGCCTVMVLFLAKHIYRGSDAWTGRRPRPIHQKCQMIQCSRSASEYSRMPSRCFVLIITNEERCCKTRVTFNFEYTSR